MKKLIFLIVFSMLGIWSVQAQHTIPIYHTYYTVQFDTIFCQGILNDYWQTTAHYKQIKPNGVDRKTIGGFTVDPLLPVRFQTVRQKDYQAWNKTNPNDKLDIGHIVPYEAMAFNKVAAKETMLFSSNTAFQSSFFNEHQWELIEKIVLDSIGANYDSVHVFTGVLISLSHPKKIGNAYKPDYYFKVVVYNGIKEAWLGLNDKSNTNTNPKDILLPVEKLKEIIKQYYPKIKLNF